MADKKQTDKAAAPAGKVAAPRKKGKLGFIIVALIFSCSLLFIMPTFVLVMVGMVPTLVALVTDDDRERSTAIAIGSLNCVGVMPFVIDLWVKGQSISNVFALLFQLTPLLIMWGSAFIGQLIIFAVPQATAAVTLANAERRLKLLNEHLTSLKAAWGADVATTKPLSSLRPEE